MSTAQEAAETPAEAATDPVTDLEAPAAAESAEPADEDSSPNAEAAKYRRRLREAEAERDKLAGNLEATRRQVAERMVADSTGDRLGDPKDLWQAGVELADLLDESGAVDPAKVAEAQARVIAEHPTWKHYTFPDLGQGARGGLSGPPDLADMLNRAAR